MSILEELHSSYLNQSIFRGVLKNGLRLIILPRKGFKETVGIIKVNYGGVDTIFTVGDKSVNQPYGLAHFLEHQVFENFGQQDFSQKFTSLGADSNAFTSFTSTSYYFSTIEQVEECLDLLQDLVSQARFTEASMLKEKGIIKQEIDMYQDDADYRLYAGVLASLFPKTPLAQDLAGNHQSIDAISFAELQQSFDTFYRPDQFTLLLVGDLDPETSYQRVEHWQEQRLKKSQVSTSYQNMVYKPVKKKDSIQLDISRPKLALGFRPKQTLHDDLLSCKLALRLYLSMVIGWTSSHYQSWYETGKIDDAFDFQIEVNQRFQFVLVTLDTEEPIAMAAKIRQALRQSKNQFDLTEDHFQILKKELYGEFLTSLDNLEELAVAYLDNEFEDGSYFDYPRLLSQLTLADVCQFGRDFFAQADSAEFIIFPS